MFTGLCDCRGLRVMAQKRVILVIDDEEAVREAITDILDLEEIPVLTAPDGETGKALFAQRQDEIALVVLDLTMPGLSGEETLRQLKEIDPELKVLLSSGYTRAEVADLFAELGVAGFLQKPYNALRLIDAVKDYLADMEEDK